MTWIKLVLSLVRKGAGEIKSERKLNPETIENKGFTSGCF